MKRHSSLQLREVFHIEFLRWLGRVVKAKNYAVKGGVNLRLFFKSFRYSEDMDLDASGIAVHQLKEAVIKILNNHLFKDNLKPFGITQIMAQDIIRAKQAETTQRFKIHLISASGEDLFTKIEFSRRGFYGDNVIGAVDDTILRAYKLPPLLAPHYDSRSAIIQKLGALAGRRVVQARDIFDIYVLLPQYVISDKIIDDIKPGTFSRAYERIFEVEFEQFSDTVAAYLSAEDQAIYDDPKSWEEVRLKVAHFIEEARNVR